MSFVEFKQIHAQSKGSLMQALFYIQRIMRNDRFGHKFWGKRRKCVSDFFPVCVCVCVCVCGPLLVGVSCARCCAGW